MSETRTPIPTGASGASATGVPARQSPDQERLLAERYGLKPKRGLLIGIIAASLIIAAAITWFVWAQPAAQQGAVEFSDLTHSIDSDAAVTLSWRLVVEPGRQVDCAVAAMNEMFAIVGWKVVHIPASGEAIRDFTERVLTTERATTGFVYTCWLP